LRGAKTMIENPIHTQRALLIWQRPLGQCDERRDRFAVAELVQGEGQVSFRYFDDDRILDAKNEGFNGYPGLPVGFEHLDRVAIGVLIRRLPPKGRADFGEYLETFGLSRSRELPDLTLLAYTGARSTNDSFSICETFDGFQAPFTFIFDVAGSRHYEGSHAALEVGEPLRLEREEQNEYDQNAVSFVRSDGAVVGYVNRLQAKTVGSWLGKFGIKATVFRKNGRAEYTRLFVRADVSALGEAPTD